MDEARAKGLLVGVCSAATKGSAVAVVQSLLGPQRFGVGLLQRANGQLPARG